MVLVRAVPAAIHGPAKRRAAREGRSLQWLLVQALREYGEERWTPLALTQRLCPDCRRPASERAPKKCPQHLV